MFRRKHMNVFSGLEHCAEDLRTAPAHGLKARLWITFGLPTKRQLNNVVESSWVCAFWCARGSHPFCPDIVLGADHELVGRRYGGFPCSMRPHFCQSIDQKKVKFAS